MDLDLGFLIRLVIGTVVILVVTAVALRYLPDMVDRLIQRLMVGSDLIVHASPDEASDVKRQRTIGSLGRNLTRVGIIIVAIGSLLALVGIDLGNLLTGLGLIGLAVGLGSQSLVKDVVAGTFILLENQYARGDVVGIAGVTGTVEDVGLRRSLLRDADGTLHSVPNGLIGVASNQTRVWQRVSVEIPIRDPLDLDRGLGIAEATSRRLIEDPEWQARVFDRPAVDRVTRASASGVVISVSMHVPPEHRASVESELLRRLVEAFAREGITIGG